MTSAKVLETTKFDASFAKATALRMVMSFGYAGATKRMDDRLAAWTGDTRRDGDTPKEFWMMVLEALKELAR